MVAARPEDKSTVLTLPSCREEGPPPPTLCLFQGQYHPGSRGKDITIKIRINHSLIPKRLLGTRLLLLCNTIMVQLSFKACKRHKDMGERWGSREEGEEVKRRKFEGRR